MLTVFVKVSPETFRHQFERNVDADVGEAPPLPDTGTRQKTEEEELLTGTFQMSLWAVPLTGVGGGGVIKGWAGIHTCPVIKGSNNSWMWVWERPPRTEALHPGDAAQNQQVENFTSSQSSETEILIS